MHVLNPASIAILMFVLLLKYSILKAINYHSEERKSNILNTQNPLPFLTGCMLSAMSFFPIGL
jgi:hypothetical protein